MADVVERAEFEPVLVELEAMKQDIAFLRSLLTGAAWLTRAQTITALNCSESTLHRLTKDRALAFKKTGKFVSYDVQSVRIYLAAQKIESKAVDNRILMALQS